MRLYLVIPLLILSGKIYSQEWIQADFEKFVGEYQEQKLPEALATGELILDKLEKNNRTDTVYSFVAYYMGQISFSQADYVNAAKWAGKARGSRAKWQGTNNLEYAAATYFYGICFGYALDYQTCLPYMEEAASICKSLLGEIHPYTLHYYNQLAHTMSTAGSYHRAMGIAEKNWELVQKNYKTTDSMYIVQYNAISQFYTVTKQYEKSEPFFLQALDYTEKTFGKESTYYYQTVQQALKFYKLAQWPEKAEKMYRTILEIYLLAGKGEKGSEYYYCLDSTARYLMEVGYYEKAQKAFEESSQLTEKLIGKKSAEFAQSLNNIAVTLEKQGKYKEAEKMYLKTLELKAAVYKKKSGFYALSLFNLSVLYYYMGEYEKANQRAKEALDTFEEVYGKESFDYAMALANAASLFNSAEKNQQGLQMLEQSISIYKKLNKTESPEYLVALDQLARLHANMNEYKKAEAAFSEEIALREKIQGKDHVDLGSALFNFANFETSRGRFYEAEKMLDRAFTIQEKALGKNHVDCAKIKQSLADVYAVSGRYTKAEKAYDECADIFHKTIGKLHPEYAIYLGNRGLFYFKKGEFEKAEKYIEQAMRIQHDTYGKESEQNIALYNNMGLIKMAKHNYKEAEKIFNWCSNKTKLIYGDKNAGYAISLNSLANLYYELGNYPKSQELYEKALAIRKEVFGDKQQEYASALNNLGSVYLAKAYAAKDEKERNDLSLAAVVYFKKGLAIDSVIFGSGNIELTGYYNNLAEAYRLRKEVEKANELYARCIAIENKELGPTNAQSAVTLSNFGLLYAGTGDYKQAIDFLVKSNTMYERVFGKASPNAVNAQANLAYVYDLSGDNAKAENMYDQAMETRQKEFQRNFTFLSEEEKERFVASMSLVQNQFNAFALKVKNQNKDIVSKVYAAEIKNKGALLRSSTRMKNAVLASGDAALIDTYNNWSDVKQQLSVLYSIPIENREISVDELENKANQLEKLLIEKSSDIKNAISEINITYREVKEKLLPTQAGIEFIHFTLENTTAEDVYCALVIRKNYERPEMVQLCTARQLDSLLGSHANNLDYVKALYDPQGKLYKTIWAPLENHLEGVNEVFYSATGLLHKVSFSSLRKPGGSYIAEQYQLHALNTTAAILTFVPTGFDPAKSTMAMFGGVKYTTDQTKNEVWKYLAGTLAEANDIKNVVSKSGMMASAYTGTEATEKNLKQLDGKKSPELLHVATHGFFFGDPEETKKQIHVEDVESVDFRGGSRGTKTLVENSNPLMRSGIVLAGANDIWNEESKSEEDGVLTAYEVSLLNLQNTKLTVLSACETGLGDIKGSEGVYGLQRAFRIAGVKQLIMSLWQVPDKETEEFMVNFYTNLVKLKNTNKAFEATQKAMRAKYEPYYWGAFVLIE
ncbi:MAG TPA: tetratricopeptide repeat protein [Flavobacteriales bacterium]|nr:tetratricopeptide repeat protein [Flavobacteriales bacterium]